MENDKLVMDITRKFVRLVERRPDGLVEFEFSIGEPELFVEMMLPQSAYEAFCEINQVIVLEGERPANEDESDWDWNLHEATSKRFRQP